MAMLTVPGGKRLLVLHCSEGVAFEPATAIVEGRRNGLPVERMALPGGAWWLARLAAASEGRVKRWITGNLAPLQEAAGMLLGDDDLAELVLVAHQGCGWYRRTDRKASPGELVKKQGEDLYRAADEARRWAPRYLKVTGYLLLDTPHGPETKQLFG